MNKKKRKNIRVSTLFKNKLTKKKTLVVKLSFLLLTTMIFSYQNTGSAEAASNSACFQRLYRDDFGGNELNQNRWAKYEGPGTHSIYSNKQKSSVSVRNGKLQLVAFKNHHGKVQSGGVRYKGFQTYGKFVARVRVDHDMSMSTSGVMLTWPKSQDKRKDGENDIFETRNHSRYRSKIEHFIKHPNFVSKAVTPLSGKTFYTNISNWHEITFEWTKDYTKISVKNPHGRVDTFRLDENSKNRIPDVEHSLRFQLDLFGNTLTKPVWMQVDWVEIYKQCGT